jgi:hypothetical protein
LDTGIKPGKKAARDCKKKKCRNIEAMQRIPVVLRKGLPSTLTNVKGTDSSIMYSTGFFFATVFLLVGIIEAYHKEQNLSGGCRAS